jgi:6,7-dimethyl-8-ribityllumazine synthase
LAQLQIAFKLPIIHGVYLFENEEQARVRCLEKSHNRGTECGRAALEMAAVMKAL